MDNGQLVSIAITEFKRPGSINKDLWRRGFTKKGKSDKMTADDTRQLTRYMHKVGLSAIQYIAGPKGRDLGDGMRWSG